MGFRFHKALNLIPDVKLNISKSGPSVSVGGKGMTYNFGGKRDRATVGLPGTGLSYSETSSRSGVRKPHVFGIIIMVLAIGYAIVNAMTDGKVSLAHWQDLLTQQTASSNKANTESDKGDDEDGQPEHHRRPHRAVHKASD